MDRLYIPVIIKHPSIVAQQTFYCNDNTITEFGIIDSKNSSTAYVILYELMDLWVLDSNRRVGVWSLPWRWHILSIPLTTCGLDDVFPPDDLCSRSWVLKMRSSLISFRATSSTLNTKFVNRCVLFKQKVLNIFVTKYVSGEAFRF